MTLELNASILMESARGSAILILVALPLVVWLSGDPTINPVDMGE